MPIFRRQSLKAAGLALASAGLTATAGAQTVDKHFGPGAHALEALKKSLAALPRRRDFKTVPMILDNRDQWDAEALDEVLHYAGGPKQSWDNTDFAGTWLNVMRNSMNAQAYSFKHPDFLCVSATHGTAQFALYDNYIWEKYQIGSKVLGGKPDHNAMIDLPENANHDPKDFQDPKGAFGPSTNSVIQLQRRGAVFMVCHNAIWEHCERLIALNLNPDKLGHPELAAEISNHLIPDAVLTPGAVGTLVELARAGFAYTR